MLKQLVIIGATALILTPCAADAQQAQIGQPRIPVPTENLLKQQPHPVCEYKVEAKGGDAAAEAAALRTKLDYERQCYRHSELIVRERLHALQASVRATVRAIERNAKRAQARPVVRSRTGRAPARNGSGGERPGRDVGDESALQP